MEIASMEGLNFASRAFPPETMYEDMSEEDMKLAKEEENKRAIHTTPSLTFKLTSCCRCFSVMCC